MRENKDIYSEFNVFQDEATVEGTLHIVPKLSEGCETGHRTVLPVPPYNNNLVAHDLCRCFNYCVAHGATAFVFSGGNLPYPRFFSH